MAINSTEFFYRSGAGEGPSSDVVFLVDQSNSMLEEHRWLINISTLLGNPLPDQALPFDTPDPVDRFGLVGFAEDDPETSKGVVIPMESGAFFGNASEFSKAANKLKRSGRFEDGYHAIQVALENFNFRHKAACLLILITDEGQSPLEPAISQSSILAALQQANCSLHVIVKEEFGQDALGMTSSNDAYIALPDGGFELLLGAGQAFPTSGDGNTHEAYVQLALATGGTAWNLRKLRAGSSTALSFSSAFADRLLKDTLARLCSMCTCQLNGAVFCKPCQRK